MNKLILIGIGIILILLGVFAYDQYTKLNSIEVKTTEFSAKDLSLSGVTIETTAEIYNPAMISLTVNRVSLNLFANNVSVGKIDSDDSFILTSKEKVEHSFEFRIDFKNLGLSLLNALRQGNVDWAVKGNAKLDLLGFEITQPIEMSSDKN